MFASVGILLGYTTALLSLLASIPQFIVMLKTGHIDKPPTAYWVLWTHSLALWVIYAILVEDIGIIIAQILSLALTIALFRFALRHRDSQK